MIPVREPRAYPKSARLRSRREYMALQREGHRRHTSHLVVIHRPTATRTSRLGVTVSKRVGIAVVRNRVKRLLREVFRHYQHDIWPPADVVIIAKPGAEKLSYAQVATEFANALALEVNR